MRLALLVFWVALLALACRAGEMPVEVDHAACPGGGVRPQSCADEKGTRAPEGWQGPMLTWSGAPEAAPECPEQAPVTLYEGYGGLSQHVQCPTCSCGPSACRLSGAYARDAPCTQGNVTLYPAPEGWDGSCWSNGIIPGPKAIATGFFLTTEAPCEPQLDTTEVSVELSWATMVRVCQVAEQDSTCGRVDACSATRSDFPPDFAACIFQEGEALECPREYPERNVFYRTIDRSNIGCSPCSCGLPKGGVCDAIATTWSDTACTDLIRGGLSSTYFGMCGFTVMGESEPLGSISAYWFTNEPGTCAPSGGEPISEAVPVDPVTFCCGPR